MNDYDRDRDMQPEPDEDEEPDEGPDAEENEDAPVTTGEEDAPPLSEDADKRPLGPLDYGRVRIGEDGIIYEPDEADDLVLYDLPPVIHVPEDEHERA